MRIIYNIIFFFVFLILAIAAMFLGGVSGVAGTFYLMVKEGNIQDNLEMGIGALVVALLVVMILRGQNKKVLKQRKHLAQEAAEPETAEQELANKLRLMNRINK